MKNCTPLWREAHFQVKMYKTNQALTTFGSCDVEKVYAVVARSTFRSQNVQSTTCSDHFLTFRCRFAWQAHGVVHLVKSEQNVTVLWHFQKRWQASQLPKVVRTWCVFFYILSSKCASRHNGVHFFDISTSKSGPDMVCFVHFDLKMCFAPQRRAIFHLSSAQLAPHPPL